MENEEEDWPPRGEPVIVDNTAISVDYIKVYAALLTKLANAQRNEQRNEERNEERNENISVLINKVIEGTQTQNDLSTIQNWLGSPEI
uniref:Uncharacterized protein n=1 Tax=viral metagenome TaxID=1070528 RepID=A0A6C0JZ27_9ZZZZ